MNGKFHSLLFPLGMTIPENQAQSALQGKVTLKPFLEGSFRHPVVKIVDAWGSMGLPDLGAIITG
jgi:hypothetical protein